MYKNIVIGLAGPGGGGGVIEGGSVAPPTTDTFLDYIMYVLSSICDTFSLLIGWLSMPYGSFIDRAFGWIPLLGDTLSSFVKSIADNVMLNGVKLTDYSLVLVMLGQGLLFYLVFVSVRFLYPPHVGPG